MSLSKERLRLCADITYYVRNADAIDEARKEELRCWIEHWKSARGSLHRQSAAFIQDVMEDQPLACGLKVRLGSFWIGAHWSPQNKRLCINLIPCVTLWVVFPGGVKP